MSCTWNDVIDTSSCATLSASLSNSLQECGIGHISYGGGEFMTRMTVRGGPAKASYLLHGGNQYSAHNCLPNKNVGGKLGNRVFVSAGWFLNHLSLDIRFKLRSASPLCGGLLKMMASDLFIPVNCKFEFPICSRECEGDELVYISEHFWNIYEKLQDTCPKKILYVYCRLFSSQILYFYIFYFTIPRHRNNVQLKGPIF